MNPHPNVKPFVPLADPIGAFTNLWRNRRVRIYADPLDPTMVYTIGESTIGLPPNYTHEPREAFKEFIGSFKKVFK